ncbi:uncharacterized protein HMPREF1541_10486 [Cyphellophora europaea CBS 101466]|uniref:Initiation-specific alpha-1,6-mannosyltransferase n=1 Tax=Cyphellophora europaea (strain CBS 101466) TaxID=1220924 RepID=W2S6I0_CYPE1|nr:uncharacterized protein HMPREF1541_10486 [Cyphellophora europaea CBS 101466]ETN44306.1 hypothetical protein HMPREF1541_10486 [Cyphellophora europaea CBS 101466]
MFTRRKQNVIFSCMFAFFFIIFFRLALPADDVADKDATPLQERFPLVWKHVHMAAAHGGAWHIPSDWLPPNSPPPSNITHAAQIAADVASSESQRYLSHSSIPRIVHQVWKSTNIHHFPNAALPAVESWLEYATDPTLPSMAYFMWDDEGMLDLIAEANPDFLPHFEALPRPVEKADVFRVFVCNSVGGVYGDIDTTPLRPPTAWIQPRDIAPWVDPETDTIFVSDDPVALVLGIEADTDEHADTFWRMGYTYPVQLTQWALAGSRDQPVLNRFLENFRHAMEEAMKAPTDLANAPTSGSQLRKLDPLELTGPSAITKATKDYLAGVANLRWQALSGLQDGGHSKLVQDTLILPITGFSPGRGKYGNMGSKPYSDPDARLRHDAQGSWRKFDVVVEIGKACRTVFGGCRYWSKTPG